jgi:D-alanine transfer protein
MSARHPHLSAGLAALLVLGALVLAAAGGSQWLAQRHAGALLRQSSTLKDQGRLLQLEAFRRADVLPLYGSSELVKPIGDKASIFFKRFPTEFEVSPVGKAGTTSLIVAEKVGALGDAVRGHKIAVSLSPSFFYTHALNAKAYAGNFSPLLASELLCSDQLSLDVRRDLARRMAAFPATLRERPLLRFLVQRLSADRARDRWLFSCARPVARCVDAVVRLQDLVRTGLFIAARRHSLKTPPHREEPLLWDNLVALWESRSPAYRTREEDRVIKEEKHYAGDAEFIALLERSSEWGDLTLLLRTFRELGAEPLLLSIPINASYIEQMGVSAAGRRRYYEMLESLAAREGVAVADFREHEGDAKFFADTHDHLSPKGWIFFNQALDEFYHGRPLSFVAR